MPVRAKCVRWITALAVVWLCTAATGVRSDRGLLVVAIADDVDAIVIRSGSTQLVTYTLGETVQGTQWRLVEVRRGEAILHNAQPYNAATLELRLRVGQRLEPGESGEIRDPT